MRRWLAYLPGLAGWILVTWVAVAMTVQVTPLVLGNGSGDKFPWYVDMLPAVVATLLGAIPVRWPWGGGAFLAACGAVLMFTGLPWRVGAVVLATASLFLVEGRRLRAQGVGSESGFLLSYQRKWLVTLGLPVAVFLGLGLKTWIF